MRPYRDEITATIGDHVRFVAIGKNITQTIIERDQINQFTLPGEAPPLYVNVPTLPPHFLGREKLLDELARRLCAGLTTALSADGLLPQLTDCVSATRSCFIVGRAASVTYDKT